MSIELFMSHNYTTTCKYCKECDPHYKILSPKNGDYSFNHILQGKSKNMKPQPYAKIVVRIK